MSEQDAGKCVKKKRRRTAPQFCAIGKKHTGCVQTPSAERRFIVFASIMSPAERRCRQMKGILRKSFTSPHSQQWEKKLRSSYMHISYATLGAGAHANDVCERKELM